jgi:membrane protein
MADTGPQETGIERSTQKPSGNVFGRIVARVQRLRVARVMLHYIELRGPIIGSGLAYAAIFAVFAALWVGFAAAGVVIAGNVALQDALLSFVDEIVPGLIQSAEDGSGAVDPEDLLNAQIFGWTGLFAAVVLLLTAINWLASARDAVRILFELPPIQGNFFLLKLGDLGLALAFGAVLLVSAVLSVVGTQATGIVLEGMGIDDESVLGTISGRVVSLTVMFVLDALALAGVYRVLSRIRVPIKQLRGGALLAAGALGVLKVAAAASLIGAGGNNPLLSSFAVILGLLVFFNLVCQVILIGAAWVAIGVKDRGIVLDEAFEQARLEEARRLVQENTPAEEPAPRGRVARLFSRFRPRRRRVGGRS